MGERLPSPPYAATARYDAGHIATREEVDAALEIGDVTAGRRLGTVFADVRAGLR